MHDQDAVTSVHPVDDKLPVTRLVPAALQRIAAIYAGVVTPALIIGQTCGLDLPARTRLIGASPLIAGVATITPSEAGLDDSSDVVLVAVALGAGIIPPAAPTFYDGFPAWVQTVPGSGISAGVLAAVLLNLFFHHLGTRSGQPAPALKSS
ncbi:hypothetical protein BFF78_10105 [Streptomyces fodineus]|uniref:Purine permease n=1 Tax=Streptomyces fodineus TaxID=1904616 RepID=A0A1D7Y6Z1_9ACTN|nr:hypothetical protein BFF78_10105 [Streptomyces fodineus]